MRDHGTAVLDRPAEATPRTAASKSARQRWLDKCESELAEALATKDACLLPAIAQVLFADLADVCPDCHGSGYSWIDGQFITCNCMNDEVPAYDLPRYERGQVHATTIGAGPGGRAEVWVPCPECEIGPVETGPYLRGRRIESSWMPDCRKCGDTGWVLSGTGSAGALFGG